MNILLWVVAILFLMWVFKDFLKDFKNKIKDEVKDELIDEFELEHDHFDDQD